MEKERAERLAEDCVARLKALDKTVTCAESCTGGLLAKCLTDVSGASSVFHGSVVSYCDRVKAELLGVPKVLLEKEGAVSEAVALAMAEGVRRLMGADYALSSTGVAGPNQDERGNPVGCIFVALATPQKTLCLPLRLGEQGRDTLRYLTAESAFRLLQQVLEEEG